MDATRDPWGNSLLKVAAAHRVNANQLCGLQRARAQKPIDKGACAFMSMCVSIDFLDAAVRARFLQRRVIDQGTGRICSEILNIITTVYYT